MRIQERCRKKENLLERTYDELMLVDVFKKRYSEANNTVGSAARLRLVVCKTINEALIKIISFRK